MNPALYKLLETHYRSRRNGLLILGGICLVIMIVAGGWGLAGLIDGVPTSRCPARTRNRAACIDRYENEVITRTALLTGIPGLLVLISGILVYPLRDLSEAPLIRTFTSRREEVAWIYPKRTSVRRYGVEVSQIHEVVVCLTSGKRHELTMSEADVQATMRLMAAEAPRAAAGYSPDTEAQYARSPASVMKPVGATLVSAGAGAPPAFIAIAPDCPFSRIDTGLRYLGLAAEPTAPVPSPLPGEPAQAHWSGKGMRVSYSFDASVYLRLLEVHGGDAAQLRAELANVIGVPVMTAAHVAPMLGSPDPRAALCAMLAAEATFNDEERRAHKGAVERLKGHQDEAVARAAQRIFRAWS